MPKSCVAVNCSNHNCKPGKDGKKISFHVFPQDKARREKWIHAVNRINEDKSRWSPSKHAVLCGEHFIEGKPNSNPDHPDYVPTIFSHVSSIKLKKSTIKVQRFESAKGRRTRKISFPDKHPKKIKIAKDNQLENDQPQKQITIPENNQLENDEPPKRIVIAEENQLEYDEPQIKLEVPEDNQLEYDEPQIKLEVPEDNQSEYQEPQIKIEIPEYNQLEYNESRIKIEIAEDNEFENGEPQEEITIAEDSRLEYDEPGINHDITDDNQLQYDDPGINMAIPGDNQLENDDVQCASTSKTVGPERPNELPEHDMQYMYALEMYNLRKERDEAQRKCKELQDVISQIKLTAAGVTGNNNKCMFYTGLSWEIFFEICRFLEQFVMSTSLIPNMDQFFLTLVKLRIDMPFQFLADQAGYNERLIIKTFWRWIDLIFNNLSYLIKRSDVKAGRQTLPTHFKHKFPRLTTIIDCLEIFSDRPPNCKARELTYSCNKKHTTVKFLIGYTPLGAVSFISKAFGGSISDVELLRKSGFLDSKHLPGDQILAAKDFLVEEDTEISFTAELIIPNFTKDKQQLSAKEVETLRKVASVKIHIERILGQMKDRFAILQKTLPLNLVKTVKDEALGSEFTSIDKIVTTCAILVNLGEGIVTHTNKERPY